MPNVVVNEVELAYVERGDGEPVVFVHGGSGDLRSWHDQVEYFATTRRAIALSCRGYHPNAALGPDERVGLDTFVADLAEFLRVLQLAPVHLVGHSSPGGFGALLLARRHPELLRSLVLVEPPAFPLLGVNIPPTPPQIVRLMLRRPRVAAAFVKFGARGIRPALAAFERGDDEAALRSFMRANLGDEAFGKMPRARFDQAVANVGPLKAQIRAGFPPFAADDARSIRVPTLLVSGGESNLVIREVTSRLQRLVPNAERLDIPRASHNMFETNPEAFNGGVLRFLDQH
jgi:pimeloyl-ACP methyl ester carboxylesterase